MKHVLSPFRAPRAFRHALFASVGLLLAVGCAVTDAEPVCGDGLREGIEACDGNDVGADTCAAHGFAEGTLSCSSACTVDTGACIPIDGDGDGLAYADEQTAGSDPNNPDSDTDGFLDGDEWNQGADPVDMFSWPFDSGTWPNRLPVAIADGLVPHGWSVGAVVQDVSVVDQFTHPFEFHQFYGYKIMASFGAVWCGPCQQAASSSPALWEKYKDQGFMMVEVLVESAVVGSPSTQANATAWANKYGLKYPVAFGKSFLALQSLPTYMFINSDMTLLTKLEGYPGDAALESYMAQLH